MVWQRGRLRAGGTGFVGESAGAGLRADDSKRIACPKCGAGIRMRCRGKDGHYLQRLHTERQAAFKEVRQPSLTARRQPAQRPQAEEGEE